jgi:transposase
MKQIIRFLHLTLRDRVRIISDRFDYHLSLRTIARRRKCALSTVHLVCKQYHGHVDWEERRRHGCTRKLNRQQLNHLFNIIRSQPNITSNELSRHFLRHDNIRIDPRTIRRYRRLLFHSATELLV